MPREMLIAMAGGAISGFASMAFLWGIPGAILAVYLAPLPLLLVGLDHGIRAVSIAALGGIVFAGVFGGPMAGVLYAAVHALPMWIIVWLALIKQTVITPSGGTAEKWYPAGYILCILSVLAAGMMVVAFVSAMPEQGGLIGMVKAYLEQVFSFMMPTLEDAARAELVDGIAPLFPGYLAISWVVMAAINASIAMAVLTRVGRTMRPKTKLTDLALQDWMSWALIGAAAMALLGQGELEYIGRNLALILAVPFFFLGLAVVHTVVRRVSFPGTLITAFYVMLILSGWIAMIVIGTGLIEQWAGIRRHLKGPGPVRNGND
ncbi:MAG: DUF2232 domain-containing protein [Rhodospirillaceae bacterium]|nr:DUF2232 domain-containing protein [Rhodospirillaceae bacterium]